MNFKLKQTKCHITSSNSVMESLRFCELKASPHDHDTGISLPIFMNFTIGTT